MNMPILGERIKNSELGLKGHGIRIFAECSYCEHQRFVAKHQLISDFKTQFCQKCSHPNNPNIKWRVPKGRTHYRWNDGIKKDGSGYSRLRIFPDDFFYSMADKVGYVLEHRLVMAKHLGRCLHSWEIVHHKGTKYPKGSIENRGDNRIENLQLVTDDRHKQISILERKIVHLETENKKLKSLLNAPRCAR